MVANGIYLMFQSAFRPRHSTETALVRDMNDILLAKNWQRVTLLVLLDLSAAFDTVNYEILLKRLHTDVGIREVPDWFKSYINERSQRIVFREQCRANLILTMVFCRVHVWYLCYSLFMHRTFLKLLKNILSSNYILFRRRHTTLP